MYVYVCMYVHTYICTYVCMCVYVQTVLGPEGSEMS